MEKIENSLDKIFILKMSRYFYFRAFPNKKYYSLLSKNWVLPSTREVSRVTFAALRLPAGKAIPILSSLSLRFLPPSFDLALMRD